MEISYLEIKDRLEYLYKRNELKQPEGKTYDRFTGYVKIFLGEDVDVSKVDSTNLREFVRKIIKDMHPDSNDLSSNFNDIIAFISSAYTDIRKNADIHPTFAMNFEYVSKQELENRNNKANANTNTDNPSTDDSLDNTQTQIDVQNVPKNDANANKCSSENQEPFTNTVETGVTNVEQPINDRSSSNENSYNNNREIIINYVEVKERLIKASKDNLLSVINTTAKERYTKYCQIILGINDIRNVDSVNFRNVCIQIANDFGNETINNREEKIFVAEDNDLQNIQGFLNGALGELNDKFEILSDNPYKISYVGRSKINEADEALAYNMRNMKEQEPTPDSEPTEPEKTKDNELTPPEPTPIPALPEKNKKDVKAYMKAIGKLLPYALAGAGVGLATAAIVPTVTFSGLGTIRIVYSTAKLANKIVSKGFLHGKPTPVDNIIMNAKDKIKEKYGDRKIYKAIEKANAFLKNPKVQWFLNGAAVGYKIGEALDLHDKLNDLLHPEKNTVDTHISDTAASNKIPDQDQQVNDPLTNNGATPSENGIDYSNPAGSETVSSTYSDLNTGDNIDLSGIDHGFTNSVNAMSDANPVHLLTELANRENGTSIKLLKLPDGSNFTGNIGDLLQNGIDPNQVAARVVNQNGDYAWLNLQDILDVYSNGMGMSR